VLDDGTGHDAATPDGEGLIELMLAFTEAEADEEGRRDDAEPEGKLEIPDADIESPDADMAPEIPDTDMDPDIPDSD